MIEDEMPRIDPALADEIEDAIMLGKPDALKQILDMVGETGAIPADIREGLESLHYFRTHYDREPALSDIDKKKVTLMDSAWAMELLNKIRARTEDVAKQA